MKVNISLFILITISLSSNVLAGGFNNFLSIQKNNKKGFNVICKNQSFEKVSLKNLTKGNFCKINDSYDLSDGQYKNVGGDSTACSQKITDVYYDGKNLVSFLLYLCNGKEDMILKMTCNKNKVCEGKHPTNRHISTIRIVSKNKYEWTRKEINNGEIITGIFEKQSDKGPDTAIHDLTNRSNGTYLY